MSIASKAISQQLREAINASGMSATALQGDRPAPEHHEPLHGHQCGLALATVDRLGELFGLSVVAGTSGRTEKQGR